MKEHGVGKRKSSYTFEQLEQVFGQGGWDAQPCQPVLINSSGLYQELESDGSTMEEYSQEDWGNHSQDLHGYPTDQELGKKASVCDTCSVYVCVSVHIFTCAQVFHICITFFFLPFPLVAQHMEPVSVWGNVGILQLALNCPLGLGALSSTKSLKTHKNS